MKNVTGKANEKRDWNKLLLSQNGIPFSLNTVLNAIADTSEQYTLLKA